MPLEPICLRHCRVCVAFDVPDAARRPVRGSAWESEDLPTHGMWMRREGRPPLPIDFVRVGSHDASFVRSPHARPPTRFNSRRVHARRTIGRDRDYRRSCRAAFARRSNGAESARRTACANNLRQSESACSIITTPTLHSRQAESSFARIQPTSTNGNSRGRRMCFRSLKKKRCTCGLTSTRRLIR